MPTMWFLTVPSQHLGKAVFRGVVVVIFLVLVVEPLYEIGLPFIENQRLFVLGTLFLIAIVAALISEQRHRKVMKRVSMDSTLTEYLVCIKADESLVLPVAIFYAALLALYIKF